MTVCCHHLHFIHKYHCCLCLSVKYYYYHYWNMFNMHTSQYYWSATEYSKAIATPIINKFCVNHCILHCSTDAGQRGRYQSTAGTWRRRLLINICHYATDITRYHRDTDRWTQDHTQHLPLEAANIYNTVVIIKNAKQDRTVTFNPSNVKADK